MNQTEFFYKLTPQVIIDAIEKEGLMTTGLCWKLNSLENRVYDLELDNKSHIVAKFYRPGRWTKEQIQEEHEFLFDLNDQEIPVCTPLKFKDGTSIKETEGIYYAVWPRTGGRCIDEFSDEHLANLGRLLGRIHTIGKMKNAPNRIRLNSENLGLTPLNYLQTHSCLPSSCENQFFTAVKTICRIYDELSLDVPLFRIHGDCHIGNLLFGEYGFYFLDFDDFCTGPAVQDFWMLLPSNDPDFEHKLNIFLDGYRLFNDFNEETLRLIEPLRALRFIHYAGWIARRWEDPAFKDAFPHFGTEEYWLQEANDLEKQIQIIEGTHYRVQQQKIEVSFENKEEELTNKDFFWDLE